MVWVHKDGNNLICKGGIKIETAQEIMTKALKNHSVTYLESLPQTHHNINTEMINNQISQFRLCSAFSLLLSQIALLLAKAYLMNKNLLQLYSAQPLSGHWNTVMVSCIFGGNNVYDSCIPHGRFLGILEAIPFVTCSIGEVDLNEELTVCFTTEDDADNSSALSHHLTSYFDTSNNSAAFVIINGKTITFLKQENAIIVVDTHADFERNSGATVSIAPMHKIEHLLLG